MSPIFLTICEFFCESKVTDVFYAILFFQMRSMMKYFWVVRCASIHTSSCKYSYLVVQVFITRRDPDSDRITSDFLSIGSYWSTDNKAFQVVIGDLWILSQRSMNTCSTKYQHLHKGVWILARRGRILARRGMKLHDKIWILMRRTTRKYVIMDLIWKRKLRKRRSWY